MLSSAHDRSTLGSALDGSMLCSALDGLGGSTPVGSRLDARRPRELAFQLVARCPWRLRAKLAGECDVETDTQRQRQQIQPTHTEVQTVDLAGDQARAVRHDEAECLAVMHKTVTSERTAAARMRNALGGLRQQGAPPVSDWAAPKDRERWTYEVQENLRTAAPVSQTNAMDGKVATMEDIARLLNETLDELDAQYAILGGGALNDDSSMLSSALDDSALGVAFGGSTLNSAHDRSTPGFALDGSSPSPTLTGPGGSMLGSAPVGSALEGLMLNSALDGLGSSALGVAFGSSTLSSAHDR